MRLSRRLIRCAYDPEPIGCGLQRPRPGQHPQVRRSGTRLALTVNPSTQRSGSIRPLLRPDLVCVGTCRLKWKRKLCRNCVRSPRNHRQTPTFTGSHQEAFCGGKSLNRLREEMFQYHSMSVAEIAFQACLIDRSSISPSVESTTYGHSQPTILCDCDKSSKSDALTFAAIKYTVMNAGLHSAISRPRWRASPRRHAESAPATSSVPPLPLRPDHPRSCARLTLIALISR
jgi:hypothetical protein